MSDQHDPQQAGLGLPPLPAAEVADQAIGLFLEYRDTHGHSEQAARSAAVQDVIDGLTADLPALPEDAASEHGQTAAAGAAARPGRPPEGRAAERLAAAEQRQDAAEARVGRCRQVVREARRQLDEARAAANRAYRRLAVAEQALVAAGQEVDAARSGLGPGERGGGPAM